VIISVSTGRNGRERRKGRGKGEDGRKGTRRE